jgi:hypothetical protein
MTPEKKNRIRSFIYIFICIVCIAAVIFLLIEYLKTKKAYDDLKNSVGLLTDLLLPLL